MFIIIFQIDYIVQSGDNTKDAFNSHFLDSKVFGRPRRLSIVALAAACIVLGGGVVLSILIAWPSIYLEVSDRFRWRLGLPAVGQIKFEDTVTKVQLRGDAVVEASATLLFGDSHLQGLPTSALGVEVTNYAIAGETAVRLAQRIGRYGSLRQARRVILMSGANDLAAGTAPVAVADALSAAIRQMPSSTRIILVAVPPSLGNAKQLAAQAALNLDLSSRCAARLRCQFISLSALADSQGPLRTEYSSGDGVHLSTAGYRILANTLAEALRKNTQ